MIHFLALCAKRISPCLAVAAVMLGCAGELSAKSETSFQLRAPVQPSRISLEGVWRHLEALEKIAQNNGGARASGGAGFDASADYIATTLRGAGYKVVDAPFSFVRRVQYGLAQLHINGEHLEEGEAFTLLAGSAGGDVQGEIYALEPNFRFGDEPKRTGCDIRHFASMPEGAVVLAPRGACAFAQKAALAARAGAVAAIVHSAKSQRYYSRAFPGAMTRGHKVDIPVFSVSYVLAEKLQGAQVRLEADVRTVEVRSRNILAELEGERSDVVLMAGAHLDSVPQGPGLQDNGSGSAALLEIAISMAQDFPNNTVRFAWWGAEENGLIGSAHYVKNLGPTGRKKVAAYLNFDMIASENGAPMVLWRERVGDPVLAEGSEALTNMFLEYFKSIGAPAERRKVRASSDHAPFLRYGIPASGLFTGAGGEKSARQAELYGGRAGEPFDACYHKACDDLENVNAQMLELTSKAAEHAIRLLAEYPLAPR